MTSNDASGRVAASSRSGADRGQPSAERRQFGSLAGPTVHDAGLAPPDRPERLERAWDLALDVQRREEGIVKRSGEGQGEVGHGRRVCDDPDRDAHPDPRDATRQFCSSSPMPA